MATALTESGDTIRDQAEETGRRLIELEAILIGALKEVPVEPRAWVRFVGLALENARQARQANEVVQSIIQESRRRK